MNLKRQLETKIVSESNSALAEDEITEQESSEINELAMDGLILEASVLLEEYKQEEDET